VAEGMRRTNPRRAGARASLCHRLPEGSSTVMACTWRGKDWFTMILGLGVRACCVWLLKRVKNPQCTEELGPAKKIAHRRLRMCGSVPLLVSSNQRRGTS